MYGRLQCDNQSILTGSFGAAVTIALAGKEVDEMKEIEKKCNTSVKALPGRFAFCVKFSLCFFLESERLLLPWWPLSKRNRPVN